jgi:large subunit ribosomal protein L38e
LACGSVWFLSCEWVGGYFSCAGGHGVEEGCLPGVRLSDYSNANHCEAAGPAVLVILELISLTLLRSHQDSGWRGPVERCNSLYWDDLDSGIVPLMPAEITNTDEFVGLSETAHECRVKRSKDIVKLKLRTPSQLYTLKVKVERADDVIKRLKCEIVEV